MFSSEQDRLQRFFAAVAVKTERRIVLTVPVNVTFVPANIDGPSHLREYVSGRTTPITVNTTISIVHFGKEAAKVYKSWMENEMISMGLRPTKLEVLEALKLVVSPSDLPGPIISIGDHILSFIHSSTHSKGGFCVKYYPLLDSNKKDSLWFNLNEPAQGECWSASVYFAAVPFDWTGPELVRP